MNNIITLFTFIHILGWVMIFNKENEAWWKAFIPIYDEYIKYKLFSKMIYFIIVFISNIFIFILLMKIPFGNSEDFIQIISECLKKENMKYSIMIILCIIINILSHIPIYKKITKENKKSNLYLLGLIFLEPIFIVITAFNYNNKRNENDKISDKV